MYSFISLCTTAVGAAGVALHKAPCREMDSPTGFSLLLYAGRAWSSALGVTEVLPNPANLLISLQCKIVSILWKNKFQARRNHALSIVCAALPSGRGPIQAAEGCFQCSNWQKNPPGSGWHKGSSYLAFQTHYNWDMALFPQSRWAEMIQTAEWRNW